jgi:hypothetical protein
MAEKNAEDEKGFHSSLFLPIQASIRVETSGQKITARDWNAAEAGTRLGHVNACPH